MSRIDEALNRAAAAGKLAVDAPAAVVVEPRFEGSLERYAAEKTATRSLAPVERVVPVRLATDADILPDRTSERSRIAVFQEGLDGKLRGDQIRFMVGAAEYTGRVAGDRIEGTVRGGGPVTMWTAVKAS